MEPVFWIRIHFMLVHVRLRIQPKISMRIRIQSANWMQIRIQAYADLGVKFNADPQHWMEHSYLFVYNEGEKNI